MNAIKMAAAQLDLNGLKALNPPKEMVTDLLLDACSAHHPDGKAQEKVILHLLKMGAEVNGEDKVLVYASPPSGHNHWRSRHKRKGGRD